ncbi:MAG: tetratricopeptide repeat protein [Verrucomicrobia bacterium]|nr:MAG: tetratricopeptide repeat protein [Verrucomicrobiota bacterium]
MPRNSSQSGSCMVTEAGSDLQLEIGHVLFMDMVGYSKLLVDQQHELQRRLTEIVQSTEQVCVAEAAGKLIRLPVGDGMALVFFNSPEAPVRCAIEISQRLKEHPQLQLRMGVHSGPVNQVRDVNDRTNVAGAGINTAQRVMDCGDAGHILLSWHVTENLKHYRQWQPHLHDLGECVVKHGERVHVVNFYNGKLGNPELPEKFRHEGGRKGLSPRPVSGSDARLVRVRWALIAAALMIIVGIAVGIPLFLHRPSGKSASASISKSSPLPAVIPEKSIAVLPFENRSADRENAYFADGVQNEILTDLAKIADLRVISRTSVMQYKGGAERNVREIGQQLGVAHLLEGSVQRSGNRVRVTAELIDARTDTHQWAEHYDRDLADVFGIQSEIAKAIADQLQAKLSPQEKARVEEIPTENTEAYVFYLRANQISRNPDTLLEDYKTAEQLYMQAIELDPNFALAHARLASTRAEIFHFYEPLDMWKEKARAEAEIALRLQPDLAEAHFALGQCIYWMDQDYDRALKEFEIASRLSPSNGDIGRLIAAIKRRQGKWRESLEEYERVARIDPQNPNIVRELLITNTAMRHWPQAARWGERMRAMAPASLVAKIQSGYVDFWWKGDTRLLKSLLSQVPAGTDPDGVITSCRWDVAMIDRDFGGARTVLQNSEVNELSYTNAGATPKSFLQGSIELAEGKQAQAQKLFELARPYFERAVEEAPLSADRHANLGWFYAFAGRKNEAIREGRRAVELKPESKDAFDGAIMNCYLALIYARVGERDLALPLIERLLKTSGAVDSVDYSITVNDLK